MFVLRTSVVVEYCAVCIMCHLKTEVTHSMTAGTTFGFCNFRSDLVSIKVSGGDCKDSVTDSY